MALAEGAEGGFAGVYPILKVLEERGQVRRGYFIDGLGAAQFAQAGAVDRLRAAGRPLDEPATDVERLPWEPEFDTEEPDRWVLAATDPAQPFGAALPWPESSGHPARAVGAYVVIIAGQACVALERGGRKIITFPAAADHPEWPSVLAGLVGSGRARRLQIEAIDGETVARSSVGRQPPGIGVHRGVQGLHVRPLRFEEEVRRGGSATPIGHLSSPWVGSPPGRHISGRDIEGRT